MRTKSYPIKNRLKNSTHFVFDVLGLPFFGPIGGKDANKEFFTPKTDFGMEIGDSIPCVYYHGRTKNARFALKPEFYGRATLTHFDDRGGWFRVLVDKSKSMANDLFKSAKNNNLRASTGLAGKLGRFKRSGEITLWVPGELSLIDQNFRAGRAAANDHAVALNVLKEMYNENNILWPEALEEARLKDNNNKKLNRSSKMELENLDDFNIDEITKEVAKKMNREKSANPTEIAKAVIAQMAVDEETEVENKKVADEAEEAEEKRINEMTERVVTNTLKELIPFINSPSFNKIKDVKGWGNEEPVTAFNEWLRTNEESDDLVEYARGGEKAVWNETTDSEGGYTMLDTVESKVKEKRDEVSIARMMGAEILPVSGRTHDIPAEDTKLTDWVKTAEQGAWDEDEGDLGVATIPTFKYTKLQKSTDEFIADTEIDFLSFYASRWGRSLGVTENKLFLTGVGTTEPEGALVGGTEFDVLASASTITTAEILALNYGLAQQYRTDAVWTARGSTNAIIRAIQGDAFLFAETPAGSDRPGSEDLKNKRFFESIKMPAFAVDAKVLLLASWPFYTITERSGMRVRRNDQLFMLNGIVAHFVDVRFGGKVTQAEAFQYVSGAGA